MPASDVHTVALVCHPQSRSAAVRGIAAHASRDADGALMLTYTMDGDPARLRVPPQRTPRMAQELWRHTCCECFVALAGEAGYHEFNFSPSGEWAAFAFTQYRQGAPLADTTLAPRIAVRRTEAALELVAAVPLARLSGMHRQAPLALGLSAVIEDETGMLSYWALRHAPGKPDFHHRDAFALYMEALRQA